MSDKTRVAIICGGISNEREVSLKSGRQIMENLDPIKYEPSMVEISADGHWLSRLADLRANNDVAFIALHGKFGEDGRVQALLELLGIPYTGSGVLASALCMDKAKTQNFLKSYNILIPTYIVLRTSYSASDQIQTEIEQKIKYPCVVKPNESGSSVGVTIVKSKDELAEALDKAFKEDRTVMIQQFIKGRELTCAVLGNSSQNDEPQTLPPVEIIAGNEFFDYDAKYSSKQTQEICPAQIDPDMTKKLQALAAKIHVALGCDGLSRSDFILKDGELYFLEINTIPGMTEQSLAPKEASAAGMNYTEFLDKLIALALKKT